MECPSCSGICKVKTFWGTSQNAVFTQLWVAVIVYMLLWISKFVDMIGSSCQKILQLMKTSLLEKRSILFVYRDSKVNRTAVTSLHKEIFYLGLLFECHRNRRGFEVALGDGVAESRARVTSPIKIMTRVKGDDWIG